MKKRVLATAAIAGLLAVGLASGAGATKVLGTVGPGYTISLKSSTGKKVTTLKAGRYTFAVADRSSIHNFTVKGPGVANRTLTGTGFVGTKSVLLTLKAGKYTLYCTLHPTISETITVK